MKTDAELKQDIIAELTWEPSVNAAQIGVEVKHGIVTLTGHVDSYTEKLNAERATKRVAGVQGMAVEMDVRLAGSGIRGDADLARSVEDILSWTSYVPRGAIKVKAENGWITLSGNVEWNFQREAAKSAVRFLYGVVGVSDEIMIRPIATMSTVKTEIEAALKRRALTDAQQIIVDVRGADVTLSGTAHSWAERELATSSAWATPGVGRVVDNISITY